MSSRRMSLNVRVIVAAVVLVTSVAAQSVPEVLYYKFNEGSGAFTSNTASPGQGSANASLTGRGADGIGAVSRVEAASVPHPLSDVAQYVV